MIVLLGSLIPDFHVSTYWLDYVAVNRTCPVDNLPRNFGLMPARFAYRLRLPGAQAMVFHAYGKSSKILPGHTLTMSAPIIKILESPEEMAAVEELQRAVWPGSETDVVPAHLLITAIHNGGLVAGAFVEERLGASSSDFPGWNSRPMVPARSTARI